MIKKLSDVPEYRDRFGKVFRDGVTLTNVIRALAAFERSLLTFNSSYDRFVAGERSALTKEQQEGLALFTGKAGCLSCHTPPLFADNGSTPSACLRPGPRRRTLVASPSLATSETGAPFIPPRCAVRRSPPALGRALRVGSPRLGPLAPFAGWRRTSPAPLRTDMPS